MTKLSKSPEKWTPKELHTYLRKHDFSAREIKGMSATRRTDIARQILKEG